MSRNKNILIRIIQALVLVIILGTIGAGLLLFTTYGNNLALGAVRPFLREKQIGLQKATFAGFTQTFGVGFTDITACTVDTTGWCATIGRLTVDSVVNPQSISIWNLCPQNPQSAKPKSPEPPHLDIITQLFSLNFPLHSLSIHNTTPCPLLKDSVFDLEVYHAAASLALSIEIQNVGAVKATRTKDTLDVTAFSQKDASTQFKLDATLFTNRKINLDLSTSLLPQSVTFSGMVNPTDQRIIEGDLSGMVSGRLAVDLRLAPQLVLSKVQATVAQQVITVDTIKAQLDQKSENVVGTITNASSTADTFALHGINSQFSCSKNQCELTSPSVSAIRFGNGPLISQASAQQMKIGFVNQPLCVRGVLVKAELFGGTASATTLDSCSREPQVVVANGLELGTLVNLFAKDRLKITGTVSLKAPVIFSNNKFEIHDGSFSATDSGTIQYFDTNQALPEIARLALHNFNYSKVAGSLTLRGGVVTLQAALEGINPAVSATRPIHININWEENIQALFDVYQATSDVKWLLSRDQLL